MKSVFDLGDDFGPAKVIHVQEPGIALKGILVVDNVATGPAIGGLRMASDVTLEECARLARAMTLKNAAAGLSHGGGKSVLVGDPKMAHEKKETLIRAFAYALRNEEDYIFGPDMGTDETCMAWVKDEIGRSVGLPAAMGGIPLDEIGATGWGLFNAIDVARDFCKMEIKGARVAVQGFGSVGMHAARFLGAKGAILVAAADSRGTAANPRGLDIAALMALKKEGKAVTDLAGAQKLPSEAIIDVECDIWIPAARPDVINENNVSRLKTRLVAQGANIPVTPQAEAILHKRGVLCLPDFIANAGGVICAAMEYHGAGEKAAMDSVAEKIRANTRLVLTAMKEQNILPRAAANALAERRVREAMSRKRWHIF